MATLKSKLVAAARLRRALIKLMSVLTLLLVIYPQSASAQGRSTNGDEAPKIDKKTQAEIIDSIVAALNEIYVFPDVAKKMEKHLRERFKGKAYDSLTNIEQFARTLTDDLQEISNDRHLHLHYATADQFKFADDDSLTDEQKQEAFERNAYENFGFIKLERLNGNVGYLDLHGFYDASFAGNTAIAAMNLLAYCDVLIIDLRKNGGGSPSMIQLISSYFFEEPVHLNSFYIRKEDTIQQFWSHAHVQGPRMTDVDLYVLTSSNTFSAAEEFTYNLKNLKRATIVGETTGGGAHPNSSRRFANLNIIMSLPFGRAINPITGTNWEGVGVKPHIEVSQDQALDVAYLEALKKLSGRETDEEKKAQLEWAVENLEVKANPFSLNEATMRSYVGVYGPRTITFENGELYYQREGRTKYKMIPMTEDTFMFAEIDYFRLRVVKDVKGIITHLEGIYTGGYRDKSPKGSTK